MAVDEILLGHVFLSEHLNLLHRNPLLLLLVVAGLGNGVALRLKVVLTNVGLRARAARATVCSAGQRLINPLLVVLLRDHCSVLFLELSHLLRDLASSDGLLLHRLVSPQGAVLARWQGHCSHQLLSGALRRRLMLSQVVPCCHVDLVARLNVLALELGITSGRGAPLRLLHVHLRREVARHAHSTRQSLWTPVG